MALNTSLGKQRSTALSHADYRERTGGPREPQPAGSPAHITDFLGLGRSFGSHMPLDAESHWRWNNPLNLLPAMIVLFFILAVLAIVLV